MFDSRKDAIFTVLNDWLDLPQGLFEKMWDELDAATRTPEGVNKNLDPRPWVDDAGNRHAFEPAWEGGYFEPEARYSQDRADYGL